MARRHDVVLAMEPYFDLVSLMQVKEGGKFDDRNWPTQSNLAQHPQRENARLASCRCCHVMVGLKGLQGREAREGFGSVGEVLSRPT